MKPKADKRADLSLGDLIVLLDVLTLFAIPSLHRRATQHIISQGGPTC